MEAADLTAFVAVVEQGSFSAAAKRLGVAKSTGSGRVVDLETSLGVPGEPWAQLLPETRPYLASALHSIWHAGRPNSHRLLRRPCADLASFSKVAAAALRRNHEKQRIRGVGSDFPHHLRDELGGRRVGSLLRPAALRSVLAQLLRGGAHHCTDPGNSGSPHGGKSGPSRG